MEDNLKFTSTYLHTWLDAIENDSLQMASAWHNAHQWTISHMANILYPLATKLNYGKSHYGTTIQQEYYRVDFSLYTYYDNSTWTLDYAIEHENKRFDLEKRERGWFDEFAKLLPLKCAKSRVVIGYDTFDGSKISTKLKKCCGLLNNPKIQDSVTDSPIVLILFPSTNYMQSKKNANDANELLYIVEFKKDGNIWQSNDLTAKVCDEQIEKRLLSAYDKITTFSK